MMLSTTKNRKTCEKTCMPLLNRSGIDWERESNCQIHQYYQYTWEKGCGGEEGKMHLLFCESTFFKRLKRWNLATVVGQSRNIIMIRLLISASRLSEKSTLLTSLWILQGTDYLKKLRIECIKLEGGWVDVQIVPKNWRASFCHGSRLSKWCINLFALPPCIVLNKDLPCDEHAFPQDSGVMRSQSSLITRRLGRADVDLELSVSISFESSESDALAKSSSLCSKSARKLTRRLGEGDHWQLKLDLFEQECEVKFNVKFLYFKLDCNRKFFDYCFLS